MRDGRTKKLGRTARAGGIEEFLSVFRAKLVVVSGGALGAEFSLDRKCTTLGRGPGVDLAFDNAAMSRQHVAIEYVDEGFRVRDLGSTNGVLLNGRPVQAGEVEHGDLLEIGAHEFQLVIEEREQTPDTYELPSEV